MTNNSDDTILDQNVPMDAPDGTTNGNGTATPSTDGTATPQPGAALSDEQIAQIKEMRTRLHATFGQVVLTMTSVPRYRHHTVAELTQLVFEPLVRDRVALASSASKDGNAPDQVTGIAIWASVSDEVDEKIREQVSAGVFPVKLKPDEWNSGNVNWLFDVIAPNNQMVATVLANFKQVIKEGEMRIHPVVTRMIDPETLKKMGAAPVAEQ